MDTRSDYNEGRRRARVIEDRGGYEIGRGEMNPVIFEVFISSILDRGLPLVVWDPFAGHLGSHRPSDICERSGVKMIACDLEPSDFRVMRSDSTKVGPGEPIGGMVFHPPYYGSLPLSSSGADISFLEDKEKYCEALGKTVGLAANLMVSGGLCVVICRDYRIRGERVRLDSWFLSVFRQFSFRLVEVWSSEPDVILVMEK